MVDNEENKEEENKGEENKDEENKDEENEDEEDIFLDFGGKKNQNNNDP